MTENIYKIKKALTIPFIAITALLFALFLLSLWGSQAWEKIILACFFVVALAFTIETVKREFIITEQGVIIKKFFRRKEFNWNEITQLAVVVFKKKVYFLLTTTKGFFIFSNLFENHALLIQNLVDRLGDEKVEPEVKFYLKNPLQRLSLLIMSWMAVVIIAVIIIVKLSGK